MAGKFGKQVMALFLVMLLMASVVSLTTSAEDATEAQNTNATVEIVDGVCITYDTSKASYDNDTLTFTTNKTSSGCTPTPVETSFEISKPENTYFSCEYTATIAENGSLTIGGSATSDTSGTIVINEEETSITIALKSGSTADTFSSITLSNLFIRDPDAAVNINIQGSANGKVTVNEVDYRDGEYTDTLEVNRSGLPVTVTPDAGYTFVCFVNTDNNDKQVYDGGILYPSSDSTISPVFIKSGMPIFSVGTKIYTDFNEAATASSQSRNVMIPLQDITLSAGEYTLPTNSRLLIPYSESETFISNIPEIVFNSYETPTAYRTITMASDATLNIENGASVSVASKLSSSGIGGGEWNGCPTGPDGRIKMEDGSKINVKSGGNLYVWGYIYGTDGSCGEVEAYSGGTVYEALQLKDWCGSNVMLNNTDSYVLSQYYIQNIEVPLKLNYGATEQLRTSIFGDLTTQTYLLYSTLYGTNGLFTSTGDGYMIKDYIEGEDRCVYEIYGGHTQINNMSLSNYPFFGNLNLSYATLTSNMTIDVRNNADLTFSGNGKLLPGSEINVEEGSKIIVNSSAKLYLYDKDNWGNYAGTGKIFPIGYSVANGTTTIRDESSLVDAKIDINGTAIVNGQVLTSADGADITSSDGTGVYSIIRAPGTSTTIKECVVSEKEVEEGEEVDIYNKFDTTKVAVTFTSAKLHNYGDSYTQTQGSAASTNFYYDKEISMWHSTYLTKWYDVDGTTLLEVQESSAALDSDRISSESKPATTSSQTLTWTDCGSPKSDASRKVKAYKARILENNFSITLGGEIGLNLYIPMASVPNADRVTLNWGPATGRDHGEAEFNIGELTDADSIIYHFSDGGLNTHNPLAKAKTFGEYYKFTAYVAAKQMTDDITVSIYDSGNTLLKTYSYCVADYCSLVIANEGGEIFDLMHTADPSIDAEKFAKLQELCKAMLTYGAQAQTQFSYNTGNPADKDLEGYTYTPANASEFEAYGSDDYMSDVGDMTFYGSSMLLEAETTYSLWFRYENAGYEPPAATATIGGRTFTVEKMKIEGNYDAYYVRYNIMNLPANLLAEDITVSFGGTEKTYNAKTYFYLALARSGDATLIETINSLYNYNRSAVTFFN